jgi:hypothetical protein
MAVSLRGKCCLTFATASLFGLFGVVVSEVQVCLNKLPTSLRPTDLLPSASTPLPLHLPQDPRRSAPPPPPLHSVAPLPTQPPLLQIQAHLSTNPSGAGQMNSPPSGIRLRASSLAADNEKTTYQSVVRCGFLQRSVALLQPTQGVVPPSGCKPPRRPMAHRHCGSFVTLVYGPSSNTTFFEGSFCKMAV